MRKTLTLNLKRFKQIDNEHYNSHTDPCTVYIRTVYHHHHHVSVTHGRSQGQIFTKANTACSLRPRLAMLLNVVYADNILPLFNRNWGLQHSVAAMLLFTATQ